jgi:tetratricopeptide (TPR) repeat protein
MPARVARLQELDDNFVAGVHWRPVRRTLGVSAFGTNAYTADAGEHLIERHDELGNDQPHEELYVVLAGHARFTVDGEEIDAPAGTFVFLPEPASVREAVAVTDGTAALVIGGPRGAAGPPSAWEWTFGAEPLRRAGDYDGAYAFTAEGLETHPDSAKLHYDLACSAALGGRRETALEHLRRAFEGDPRTREWAAGDADLDALRDDPAYPA